MSGLSESVSTIRSVSISDRVLRQSGARKGRDQAGMAVTQDEAAEPLLVKVPQAAQMLGIGAATAYDLIKRGEFPVAVLRVGKAWRIRRSELEAFCSGPAA
jgi:excisionase family DNA binding protein